MSKCKFCKKSIKWLEVPVETSAGTFLKPKPFNPRARRGQPLTPHECRPDVAPASRTNVDPEGDHAAEIPWWQKY